MAAPAPATATATRAHALLIPYPCSGHINPTLHFARLLHSAGILVTFVNTEHIHARMERARARGHGHGHVVAEDDGFRYETIPDGLAPWERGAQDRYSMGLLRAVVTHGAGHLRALIVRLNSGAGGDGASSSPPPPVTCVVASELMSFALDVAAGLGLPAYMLWGTSACGLACGRAVGELRRRGHVPLKGRSSPLILAQLQQQQELCACCAHAATHVRRDAMERRRRRAHAMLFPFPCSGHINPTLRLAELLHARGVYVTFVNTEHNHERLQRRTGPGGGLRGREGFRFEAVPDGLSEEDRVALDRTVRLYLSLRRSCGPPLVDLARRLREDEGVPPVTCVILSGLVSFALDAVEELGVPAFVLWGTSACGFVGTLRLKELRQRGYMPLKDESDLTNGYLDTPIDWIAGMPPVRLGDISSFVRTLDPQCFGLRVESDEANSCARARGLILNTFEDLESDVLDPLRGEFPRVYTIGPLAAAMHRATQQCHGHGTAAPGLSLWEEDSECMAWLDAQANGSVLYVSFGSLAVLSLEQLSELAWGLAASHRPFLWAVRPGLVVGDRGADALPEEFLAETRGRCFIAEWCAQEQVLRHRAVGGFLTHSGWNSTAESIWSGVPMICWPGFADQYINCRYACEEWGIALRLDEALRREQVTAHVEELMGGGGDNTDRAGEMRRRAAEWKAKAEAATAPGGSSYESLGRLVEELQLGVAEAAGAVTERATATPVIDR